MNISISIPYYSVHYSWCFARPIFATRFIVENTIEERILKLQEKKKLVFDGTIGGDAASMARLTVDDMRFLFQ
jgi:DNA repair protein RAD16